jgi:hypothetical protein
VCVGRRAPELAQRLVGPERRPDREVDLHRSVEVAALERGVVRRLLLGRVEIYAGAGDAARDVHERPDPLGLRERDVEREAAAERQSDERVEEAWALLTSTCGTVRR